MRSEMFVINAVKSSEKAFSAVSEMTKSEDSGTLVRFLRNEEEIRRLAKALAVPYPDVFAALEKHILAATRRRRTPRLSRQLLADLARSDVQAELANLLGCRGSSSVLPYLLDLENLKESLIDARMQLFGSARNVPSVPESLLLEVTSSSVAQRLEMGANTAETDWAPILEGEGWLTASARERLQSGQLSEQPVSACQTLATVVERARAGDEEHRAPRRGNTEYIDWFGLTHIRVELNHIIDRLYDEAKETLADLAGNPKFAPCARLLSAAFHCHVLGEMAEGLNMLVSHRYRLMDLLGIHATKVEVDDEKIDKHARLVVDEARTQELADGKVGRLKIKCRLTGSAHPTQVVLDVEDLPLWLFDHLRECIPNLAPRDLAVGPSLAERLLRTSFPLVSPETRELENALRGSDGEQGDLMRTILASLRREGTDSPVDGSDAAGNDVHLAADFVQAVALSRAAPLGQIPDPGLGIPIPTCAPYGELPTKEDPMFPLGTDDLVERYRQEHGGRELEMLVVQVEW